MAACQFPNKHSSHNPLSGIKPNIFQERSPQIFYLYIIVARLRVELT